MSNINGNGTSNTIQWLEEGIYKELYERAKEAIYKLDLNYDYIVEDNKAFYNENEELKREIEELKREIEELKRENKELKRENKELKDAWIKLINEVCQQPQFQDSLIQCVELLEKDQIKEKEQE